MKTKRKTNDADWLATEGQEQEIAGMVRQLEEMAEAKDIEGRASQIMLLVMPGFTRAMNYERAVMAEKTKPSPSGKRVPSVETVNDHLFVMVNALANMAVAIVNNAIACDANPVCQACLDTRKALLHNIVHNIEQLGLGGIDRPNVAEQLH